MMLVAIEDRLQMILGHPVSLSVENGKLCYHAAAGVLTEEDLRWMSQYRREIALFILETRLTHVQWQYQLCREFQCTQKHYRALSQACKEAGQRAFKQMEAEMLETVI